MLRICFLVVVLALAGGGTGCSWLEKQNVDICVDYKGKHICVGRQDGKWIFSTKLEKQEEDEIIAGLGQ